MSHPSHTISPPALARWIALAALPGAAGCAFPPRDLHLAPLYSFHQTGGGGVAHEALGGIVDIRREYNSEGQVTVSEWGVHPLFRRRYEQKNWRIPTEDGAFTETDVLWPLGHFRSDTEEGYGRFFPFWWWNRHTNENGESETDWAVFPLLFGGGGPAGRGYFAFFPLFGTLRDFFTYDEISFILFPIFASTLKNPGNNRSYAILPPFTGWGSGDGGASWWRFWPFYGNSQLPGHYDRTFAMWPFWHSESNGLNTGSPSNEWMIWPFYGEVDEGAAHSRAVLWPFVGWSWNTQTGYSATDAPWPFVKIIRGGSGRPYEHTRALPFYAHYHSEEIDSTNYLWPIIWIRSEHTPGYQRDSTYVVPFFYRSATKKDASAATPGTPVQPFEGSSTLIWPLYRYDSTDEGTSAETLYPMPFPRVPGFRENYWPLFSIFSHFDRPGGGTSDRFLLNLFRRESDAHGTRWSVPFLGGRASYKTGGDDGENSTTEWSLLLGLIRWRSDQHGTRMLIPAFPGPGFTATIETQ